jgi:hypothetical protein
MGAVPDCGAPAGHAALISESGSRSSSPSSARRSSPEYVRFAGHHGLRPDSCPAADPESGGIAENLVGYAKAGLMVPQARFDDLAAANAGRSAEVNGQGAGHPQTWLPSRELTRESLPASGPQRPRRRARRCIPATETGDTGRPSGSMNSAHGPVAAGTAPSRTLML